MSLDVYECVQFVYFHQMCTNEGILTEKKVEKNVAKGKIARLEKFLFMSQCIQKASPEEASESVCIWGGLKPICLMS